MSFLKAIFKKILGEDKYRALAQRRIEANRRAGCTPPPVSTEVFLFEQNKLLQKLFTKATFVDPAKLAEPKSDLAGLKISLVVTLKNESTAIAEWVESFSKQTLLPSELVIVDASSSLSINSAVRQRLDVALAGRTITILHRPGCNIAEGRNFGVANSSGEIVAFTDLGCTLSPNWLERLIVPFLLTPEIELSAGWYEAVTRSPFASSFAAYTVPRLGDIEVQGFIPSARSFAIRRELFTSLRGFPEYLTFAGEDSLFGYYAKFLLKRAAFVPEAVVRWDSPPNVLRAFNATFNYAVGDAEGGRIAWGHYLNLVRSIPLFPLIVLKYPQRGGGPRYLNIFSVSVLLSSQLFGFVSGYRRRREVNRRRIGSAKRIVFYLTKQPVVAGNSELMGEFDRWLELDYFVVNVYSLAGAAEVKGEKALEHQRLIGFLRTEFDPERFFTSIGESVRTACKFEVVDRCDDSASRELAQKISAQVR